jgi:hypothetical protein
MFSNVALTQWAEIIKRVDFIIIVNVKLLVSLFGPQLSMVSSTVVYGFLFQSVSTSSLIFGVRLFEFSKRKKICFFPWSEISINEYSVFN